MVTKPTNTYQRLKVSYVINKVYRPNSINTALHGTYHTHSGFTMLQKIYIYIYIYNCNYQCISNLPHTHILLSFLDGNILHTSYRQYWLHTCTNHKKCICILYFKAYILNYMCQNLVSYICVLIQTLFVIYPT